MSALRAALGLVVVTLGAAVLASTAAADAVYHTESELAGLAGAPGGGMVVNVHTNLSAGVRARDLHASRCRSGHVPGDPQRVPSPTSLDCTGTALAFPTACYQRER